MKQIKQLNKYLTITVFPLISATRAYQNLKLLDAALIRGRL